MRARFRRHFTLVTAVVVVAAAALSVGATDAEEETDSEGAGNLSKPILEQCEQSESLPEYKMEWMADGRIQICDAVSKCVSIMFMLRFAGIRHAEWNGTWYFFSWEHPQTRNATATWFQARNVCRRHCMDSVSLGASAKVELHDVYLSPPECGSIFTLPAGCPFKITNGGNLDPCSAGL